MAKKLFSLTLVLLMALTMAIVLPAAAESVYGVELATNGDLEGEIAVNGTPVGWGSGLNEMPWTVYDSENPATTAGVSVIPSTEALPSRDGTGHFAALRWFDNSSSDPGRVYCLVNLKPGSTYDVSVWLKDDGGNATLQMLPQYHNSGTNIARTRFLSNKYVVNDGNNGWGQHSYYFRVPDDIEVDNEEDGTAAIRFAFRMERKGVHTYYIDDFSCKEVPGPFDATIADGKSIAPGETVTVNLTYGRTYTGFSGITVEGDDAATITIDEYKANANDEAKKYFDSDIYKFLTCVYKENANGVKTLQSIYMNDAEAGVPDTINGATVANYYNEYKNPDKPSKVIYTKSAKAFTSYSSTGGDLGSFNGKLSIPDIKIPGQTGDTDTYCIKIFAWNTINGLQSRSSSLVLR